MEQPEIAPSGAEAQEDIYGLDEFVSETYKQGELVSRTESSSGAKPAPVVEPEKPAEPAAPEDPAEGEPTAEGEQPTDDPAQPKKGTAQERIGELTRNWRAAERERDELRRQLEEVKNPPKAAETTPSPDAPNPDDAEKYPYGEIDPKYIRDLARHETKLANQEIREQEAAASQQREFQQQTTKMIDTGKQKYPDFHDKVFGGAEREDYPLSATVGELLVQSDAGADIAYHLATNPEEAARIYAMTPVDQARAFGRLEAKFSAPETAAPSPAGKVPPPRTVPAAPAPLDRARGANGKFQAGLDSENISFAEFERLADAALAK